MPASSRPRGLVKQHSLSETELERGVFICVRRTATPERALLPTEVLFSGSRTPRINWAHTVNVAGRHRFTNDILCTRSPTTMQTDSHSRSRQDRNGRLTNDTVPITPRVILADDQKEMLRAVVLTLRDEFRVVGTAENGTEAVDLTTRLCPDVLVLDVCMPVENGITAAYHLKDLGSTTRIVFLTVNHDPDFVEAAMSAGALGYVLKHSLAAELVPAIWSAMHGNVFISPSIHSH